MGDRLRVSAQEGGLGGVSPGKNAIMIALSYLAPRLLFAVPSMMQANGGPGKHATISPRATPDGLDPIRELQRSI